MISFGMFADSWFFYSSDSFVSIFHLRFRGVLECFLEFNNAPFAMKVKRLLSEIVAVKNLLAFFQEKGIQEKSREI